MSPAVARTSPALAGRRRSSNRQARCKLFFEPRRHSAFWGGYPMSDEEARPRGWAGGPRALPCERLGQGSNPASLVPKLLPLEHRFRDHTSGQGPVGELLHRLDGLPGHEAAEEQRVFLKTECASAIPFTDSWGAPPPPRPPAEAGRPRQAGPEEGDGGPVSENSQDPCIKGVQRPQERGENSPRPTQTLGSPWAAGHSLGVAQLPPSPLQDPRPRGSPACKTQVPKCFSSTEREKEIERDRRESASLLALRRRAPASAQTCFNRRLLGSSVPGSSHLNVLIRQGPGS